MLRVFETSEMKNFLAYIPKTNPVFTSAIVTCMFKFNDFQNEIICAADKLWKYNF